MQGKDIAIIIGAVVLVVLLFGLVGGGMMGSGMMGWGGYSFGIWGIIMGIVMLLFWVLVIGGIVLLVVWLFRQGQPAAAVPGGRGALHILKERYARGEISREQYQEMRRELEGR